VSAPYVVVSGSVSDALSGVGGVSCNGVPATVAGSAFSCTVLLNSVSNAITVAATDLAGNSTTATVSVSVSMAAPTSLQITPGPVTMLVGNNQSFAAIDQTGTRRPDAAWSVSDTTIATLPTDGSGTLTGVAAGQVTLTATIGSVSAQTQVTVLTGSSLTVGTALWSAPAVAGFTAQRIVQAVPTANGPDLYTVETDSSGDLMARAFTAQGSQQWQNQVNGALSSSYPYYYSGANAAINAVGDDVGGLLFVFTPQSTAAGPAPVSQNFIAHFNPQTGQQDWQYVAAGALNPNIAIGQDGTIFAVEQNFRDDSSSGTAYLDLINGATGALTNQIPLPTVTITVPSGSCGVTGGASLPWPGSYGSPIVTSDGSAYLEVQSGQVTANWCDYVYPGNWTVALLRVPPGGGSPQFQTISSYSLDTPTDPDLGQASEIIPDGQGGVLASWIEETNVNDAYNSPIPVGVADVGPQGIVQATLSSIDITGVDPPPSGNIVLGDNGNAFITDGTNVAALSVPTLRQGWTYTSTGGTLSFINATSGGGVAVNDSQLGAIQLDSTGSPSTPVASLLGAVPFDMSSWQGISNGELAELWSPDGSNGITNALPQSPWPSPAGNPQGQNAPLACFTSTYHCVLVPVADNYSHPSTNPFTGAPERDLAYGLYFLDFSHHPNPRYPYKPTFDIVNRETFATPPNTDTDAIICTGNSYLSTCDGEDNHLLDGLSEGNANLTLSVTQTFYINRQQVQVYWPQLRASQIQWYGSPRISDLGKNPPQPNQQATTIGRTVGLIYQLDLDPQNPASCVTAIGDSSYAGGCETTPSHP
jgi:Glucodextranase, domain B/Bacterial Ig-like domain (group 2)